MVILGNNNGKSVKSLVENFEKLYSIYKIINEMVVSISLRCYMEVPSSKTKCVTTQRSEMHILER